MNSDQINEKKETIIAAQPVYYEASNDEIDLADIIATLWRHRWFITFIILTVTGLGGLYCFLSTPLFEINAQIQPGITGYSNSGEKQRSLTPEAIRFWFAKKGYASVIFSKSQKISNTSLPNITATTKRDSKIIKLTLYWAKPREGEILLSKVLKGFSSNLENDLRQELQISRKRLEQQINKLELQLQQTKNIKYEITGKIKENENTIRVLDTKLDTLHKDKIEVEKAKKRIQEQLRKIYRNTNELIELRKDMIKKNGVIGVDKFTLLMYSNIVQENINYVTNLEKRLADIEKEFNEFVVQEAEIKKEIANTKDKIKQLNVKLSEELPLREKTVKKTKEVLTAKLKALQPVEIILSPLASPTPVKPKAKLIILLSFVFGFFLAIFAAFIREFLQNISS